jgi:hypothetical protein
MKQDVVARVGYGQGPAQRTETPITPPVRIRSGTEVKQGRLIGGKDNPSAFIWFEEEAAVPDKELQICVGPNGTYAWDEGGPCDLQVLYPKDREVAKVCKQLEDWQRFFTKYYDPKKFNSFFWGKFHEEGIKLARRLQAVLIDRAVVKYLRPEIDPRSREAREIRL